MHASRGVGDDPQDESDGQGLLLFGRDGDEAAKALGVAVLDYPRKPPRPSFSQPMTRIT